MLENSIEKSSNEGEKETILGLNKRLKRMEQHIHEEHVKVLADIATIKEKIRLERGEDGKGHVTLDTQEALDAAYIALGKVSMYKSEYQEKQKAVQSFINAIPTQILKDSSGHDVSQDMKEKTIELMNSRDYNDVDEAKIDLEKISKNRIN